MHVCINGRYVCVSVSRHAAGDFPVPAQRGVAGGGVSHVHRELMHSDGSTKSSGSAPLATATDMPTRWRIMLNMNDSP